jgi:hypothetical protein
MAVLKVISYRVGWSYTKKIGFFRVKTKEHGWSSATKLATPDLVAMTGALLQAVNVAWDTDAGAIVAGEQGTAFGDVKDEFTAKTFGGDPPFPGPKPKARVL